VCGAHHVHSPRHRYASLMVGRQTQESLAGAIEARQERLVVEQRAMLEALQAAMRTVAAAGQATSGTTPRPTGGMANRVAALAAQIPLPVVTPTVVTPTDVVGGSVSGTRILTIGSGLSGTLVVSGTGAGVEPRAGNLLPTVSPSVRKMGQDTLEDGD